MELPTYDGSGQATHPDVIRFATPWQGYPLWMVLTPYPFLRDDLENPSILASRDGSCWEVPEGAENPLLPPPAEGFHADPDMIHHPATDELWIYYLHTVRNQQQELKRIRSDDGRRWSPPEPLLELPYQEIRSPALVRAQDGRWRMWSVNMSGGRTLELRESEDGTRWGPPQRCHYDQPGHWPSHLDVVPRPEGSGYAMVVQATPRDSGPNPLFWSESRDGLTWRTCRRPLLAATPAPAWAEQTLYRTTFQFTPAGGLELWYSGRSRRNENHIARLLLSPEQTAHMREAFA